MELTNENLLEISNIVFSRVHSDGFKIDEIKDMLFEPTYWFLEKPNDNWKEDVIYYLTSIGYDVLNTTLNKY